MKKNEFCILCGEGKDKEVLTKWGNAKQRKLEGASNKLAYSFGQKKCNSDELLAQLVWNRDNDIITYNHPSFRTKLRKRKSSDETSTRSSKRLYSNTFDLRNCVFIVKIHVNSIPGILIVSRNIIKLRH